MDWLREIRGTKSQQTIADDIGIAQSTYASIEIGRRKPSVEMAKRIASVLGFDWTRFYEDDDNAPSLDEAQDSA